MGAFYRSWRFCPNGMLGRVVTPAFVAIVAILFLGPQDREHSAALTVFWGGWWPGIMLVFPFLGRIWCTVCLVSDFFAKLYNIVSNELDVIHALSFVYSIGMSIYISMDAKLKKWPEPWASSFGPQFAFGLFFAILMWEELWELPQNGALSACLLLLIIQQGLCGGLCHHQWCRIGKWRRALDSLIYLTINQNCYLTCC